MTPAVPGLDERLSLEQPVREHLVRTLYLERNPRLLECSGISPTRPLEVGSLGDQSRTTGSPRTSSAPASAGCRASSAASRRTSARAPRAARLPPRDCHRISETSTRSLVEESLEGARQLVDRTVDGYGRDPSYSVRQKPPTGQGIGHPSENPITGKLVESAIVRQSRDDLGHAGDRRDGCRSRPAVSRTVERENTGALTPKSRPDRRGTSAIPAFHETARAEILQHHPTHSRRPEPAPGTARCPSTNTLEPLPDLRKRRDIGTCWLSAPGLATAGEDRLSEA